MRQPRGIFINELRCDLVMKFGERVRTCDEFLFYDGDRLYSVPKHYISDGASIPWWCRWIPTLVALALVGWYDWDGYAAAVVGCLLQALVGWPLLTDFLEAAVIHDYGYEIGLPKLDCDFAFLRAMRLRIWLNLRDGKIGELRAWWKVFRALIMFGCVVLFGWPAYWVAAWRRRQKLETD